jgi:beta-1,2-mannobiose phosphorylase / 1,2-beta-oligomannan phosphorylase
MQSEILQRFDRNPILVPNEHKWWESKAVFNCAVMYYNNKFHMLYRAVGEYEKYISRGTLTGRGASHEPREHKH